MTWLHAAWSHKDAEFAAATVWWPWFIGRMHQLRTAQVCATPKNATFDHAHDYIRNITYPQNVPQ